MNSVATHPGTWDLVRGSPAMMILICCSIIVVAIACERAWRYVRARSNLGQLRESLRLALKNGSVNDAFAACRSHSSPASAVAMAGLSNRHLGLRELEEVMAAASAGERLQLEKRLWVISTIGHLSPFIGLFGTVIGIMKAFEDLAVAGGGGPSVVAAGIAEALITTAGGLAVAIPSVAIHNWLSRRVRTFSTEMEMMAAYLLAMLASDHRSLEVPAGRNGIKRPPVKSAAPSPEGEPAPAGSF